MSTWIKKNSADLSMMWIVVIWGFHFIILEDAFKTFNPVTFNAIRYALPVPFFLFIAWRYRQIMTISREDFRKIFMLVLVGPMAYQILFVIGVKYTSATNSALFVATMPAWVAVINIMSKTIIVKAALIIGIIMTLVGIGIVILSGNDAQLGFSRDDIIGSFMILLGSIILADFTVRIKPWLHKYNSFGIAIYTHFFVWSGLMLVSLPDLVTLRPSDFPMELLPHFLYSGLLASAFGRVIYNFAIRRIGSTRASAYQNLVPLVTAFAAVVILHNALTLGLLIGGMATLLGVAVVQGNTQGRDTKTLRPEMSAAD